MRARDRYSHAMWLEEKRKSEYYAELDRQYKKYLYNQWCNS